MHTQSESFSILERALDAAGSGVADAIFISGRRDTARFANSNVHQNMSEESAELTLRVIVDEAMGVAATTSFDADEIAGTAALARDAARHSDRLQNFSGLYKENAPVPQLSTYDERTAVMPPMDKARQLRGMFDLGKQHGVMFAGSYANGADSVACANTHGLRRYCRVTSADATVIAIHPRASGYATRCSRRADAVDILALGEEATLRATLHADRREDLPPGRYDVILDPPAIAEVLDWMNMITFSGQSYEEQSSFFAGAIGKQVVGTNFTLYDDSLDESFMPFPFDMEGLPKQRVVLIDRGIVRTPVVDKIYADRLGLPPTANGWDLGSSDHGVAFHLAIEAGHSTREELIRSTKLGIWVTRFNYVNGLLEPKSALMTGTTRDGTFLIRDGEIVASLPNLRWTQSMVEAFSNIEASTRERSIVGTWYNSFGATLAPTMKIRGWNFTGSASTS